MESKADMLYKLLKKKYGETNPELTYSNLYELTIAVVLSAQTTDKQVNKVTPELFLKYPDFKSLSNASLDEIEKIVHSTGFYHSKAKNILGLAKALSEKSFILPDSIEELIKLPGIGRKTANVVISQGFGKPGLAVDTHVGRIARRIGLTRSKNPDIIEKELKSMLAPEKWLEFHLLMINHGRKTCFARKPDCSICVAYSICNFYASNH
ncbi:MAG TPA: endonuclease III [Spirochaetota bacterium]|nr:endonuclease III [Spirochaetota bacterium]